MIPGGSDLKFDITLLTFDSELQPKLLSQDQKFEKAKLLNQEANKLQDPKVQVKMYSEALELVAADPDRFKTKIALMNNCAACFV